MRLALLSMILGLIVAFILPDVTLDKQKELYGSLFQISSIILGITGAWSAIVYPGSLAKIYKKDDSKNKLLEINALIKPMSISLLIIGILIVIQLASFLIGISEPSLEFLKIVQKLNLAIIITLYILQIGTIIFSFIPISDARAEAALEDKKNDLIDKLA